MADRRLLGALSGLSQGLAQGTQNLQNIMQASYKLKQEKELFNLKKKEIESNLDLAPYEKEAAVERIKMYRTANETDLQKAKMAGEEHQKKLESIQEGIKFLQGLQKPTDTSVPGTLDVKKDLGWSYNTGTGSMTISNRGGQTGLTEQWRNDVKTARDSVVNGDMSVDEAASILEDSYPNKANNIMEFRAMWSGLAPKGGKKQPKSVELDNFMSGL